MEGSVSHGGIQPHYLIDYDHPALKKMIATAKRIALKHRLAFWRKDPWKAIGAIQDEIRKALPRVAYSDPAYLELAARKKAAGELVSLGDYVERGCGVCRENAMVTQVALREAGFDRSERLVTSSRRPKVRRSIRRFLDPIARNKK